jgi:hypothetical protein
LTFSILVAVSEAAVGPAGGAWRAETAIDIVPIVTMVASTALLLMAFIARHLQELPQEGQH